MLPFYCSWMDEDLRIFEDMVNKFLDAEIEPHYEGWEKEGHMPREVWNKLGEAGLLCIDISDEYGGIGAPYEFSALLGFIMMKRGFPTLAGGGIGVHSGIVSHYIQGLGTEEQKKQYLPLMTTGECVGAIAMSEPGAGSDLKAMKTSANKVDGGYLINGSKTFISNGQHCDIAVVACKTDPSLGAKGISLFIVDATAKGFVKGNKLEKLGLHSQDTSELFFEDVFVPDTALLGPLNMGFIALMKELPRERTLLAVNAQGACEGIIDITLAYVKERQAFGQRIADFQNTRFKLAELATEVRVSKAFIDQCVQLLSQKKLSTEEASMAKLHATELQCKVVNECLQLFGGYGYMTEYRIAREYVDARAQTIYGGTSEIMKEIISRSLFK